MSLCRESVSPINACFTYTSCSNYSSVINKGNNTSGANRGSKQMYKTQRRGSPPACCFTSVLSTYPAVSESLGARPLLATRVGSQGGAEGEETHRWWGREQRSKLASEQPLL